MNQRASHHTPQAAEEPVGYWALLRDNAPYRRLWLGLAASMVGDWLRTMALYHLVLHLTGASGMALGGVMIAQTASMFLLSPIAGVVADRMNRKRVMIGADLVRAVLTLGFLAIRTVEHVWMAYVLTAALMAVSAFFHPAYAATLPNITTRRELVTANALASASWAAMLALGAALGGIVAAWLGTSMAFVLNAVTYVVSALCIATVVLPARQADTQREGRGNGWQEFWHGLRYMMAQPYILRLLSVKACSGGLSGGMLLLLALFAEHLFQAGAMGMGCLYMARGLGALLGPFLARYVVGEEPRTMYRSLGVMFLFSGGWHIVFAGMPTLWWAAAALFLATMAANVLWVFSSALLQLGVPDTYRGRVFATDFALLTVVMTVSTLLTGWGLDYAGITPRVMAVLLGGLLVLSGLCWLPVAWRREG
jgi:MFS family permease